MRTPRHWTLGAKLALVATPFLVLAIVCIGVLVWMSLQLEGGAASVNEAGRLRMQAYRLVLSAGTGDTAALPQQVAEFERSLALLRDGAPERPLFVPWEHTVKLRFAAVEQDWLHFRDHFASPLSPAALLALGPDATRFVADIDAFVAAIESHLSRWTSLMHLLQVSLMVLAVLGAALLLFAGHLFVLEPVSLLKRGLQRIQGGDFGARVEPHTTYEFGALATGFNSMAEQLQSMYRSLESRVSEKTAQLEEKHYPLGRNCKRPETR